MANNPTPEEKPKVSKLPLPISDSPLVIDLPDGQKIVIGKMIQGSVIEVATWRGVGRPDSRTSRLMLGVGNGDVNEDQGSASGQPSTPTRIEKPKDWRVVLYYIAIAINTVKKLPLGKYAKKLSPAPLLKKLSAKSKGANSAKKLDTPSIKPMSSENKSTGSLAHVDEDIEAWLNKISEKASQKSANASTAAKTAVKKSAPVKKAVKRTATSKAKRE